MIIDREIRQLWNGRERAEFFADQTFRGMKQGNWRAVAVSRESANFWFAYVQMKKLTLNLSAKV